MKPIMTASLALLILSTATFAAPPQQFMPDPPNGTVYLNRSACPGTCYPLVQDGELVDLSTSSLQDVQEPSGRVSKYGLTSCADEGECLTVVAAMTCPTAESAVYVASEDGTYEAYCPEPIMQTVRKFAPDPVKIAAKEQAEANAQAKADARAARVLRLKELRGKASLTSEERQEAILKLIMELIGEE